MTHARVFQHGVKAYLDCKLLCSNPYEPAVDPEAHEAWRDGWLDARRARRRIHLPDKGQDAMRRFFKIRRDFAGDPAPNCRAKSQPASFNVLQRP